jgi:uncharacterized protein YjbJ (UPF0337 family)
LDDDDLASFAIVVADQADLNIVCVSEATSAQDQHDDDDEKDEADEASADVDTGCEQHVVRTTPMGDIANKQFTFDRVESRVVRSSPFTKVGHTMDNDLDQAKGRVKQAVGDLTDNDDLKREGKTDENAGKVKEFLGDAKDKADDLVDKVKDKFNKN